MAGLCLVMSLAGPLLLRLLAPFLSWLGKTLLLPVAISPADLLPGVSLLTWYGAVGLILLAVVAVLVFYSRKLVAKNGSDDGPTWDRGYRYPSSRMQYSGGSFALSMALLLKPLMRPRLGVSKIEDPFPEEAKATMSVPDWPTNVWELLLFRPAGFLAEAAKSLQHGLVNIYILYIFIALMTALVWALGWT